MNRVLALIAIGMALVAPATGGARALQPSFVGSGCTISTCRYFTSSYSTAHYYYDRRTCSQWKSLTSTYLRGFKTVTALHSRYPKRILHAPC